MCQERTFTLPGARNCITRLLTGPFPRRLGLSCQPLSLLLLQAPGAAACDGSTWHVAVWLMVGCGCWHWLGRQWRAEAEPPSLCRCLCHLDFILPSNLYPAFTLHLLCSLHRQAAWQRPSLLPAGVWVQLSCALGWCGLCCVSLSRPPAWD